MHTKLQLTRTEYGYPAFRMGGITHTHKTQLIYIAILTILNVTVNF